MTEVDTKYDPDDDSSDEEAIRVRRERTDNGVRRLRYAYGGLSRAWRPADNKRLSTCIFYRHKQGWLHS